MQVTPESPWERLATVHSLDAKWFTGDLYHFSGYEVVY